jgi:hypothetical protein
MRSDSVMLVFLILGVGTLLGKVVVPIARAYARRLEAGAAPAAGDLAELQERVAELERRDARVLELEERLDFAERLLAQQRDREPGRLPSA